MEKIESRLCVLAVVLVVLFAQVLFAPGAEAPEPDSDNDFIPDEYDEHPYSYDVVGNYSFGADITYVEGNVSIAINYTGNTSESPDVELFSPNETLNGSIGIYFNVSWEYNESYTAVVKLRYSDNDLLPGLNETALTMCRYLDGNWTIIANITDSEETDVSTEHNFAWATMTSFGSFTVAYSTEVDSDGDGLKDGAERNVFNQTGSVVKSFSDENETKLFDFNDSEPGLCYVDIPVNESAIEHVDSASIVISSVRQDYEFISSLKNGTRPHLLYTDGSVSTLHVVWIAEEVGADVAYYKNSGMGGRTWSPTIELGRSTSSLDNLGFVGNNVALYVVWEEYSPTYTSRVVMKSSYNQGVSWSSAYLLQDSTQPSIDLNGSVAYLVSTRWFESQPIGTEGRHVQYINDRWIHNLSLSTSGSGGETGLSDVAYDHENIHITVFENDAANVIYYYRSLDDGETWSNSTYLATYYGTIQNRNMMILARGNDTLLLWSDNRTGAYQLYVKNSEDGGLSWTSDMRITNTTSDAIHPVAVYGHAEPSSPCMGRPQAWERIHL